MGEKPDSCSSKRTKSTNAIDLLHALCTHSWCPARLPGPCRFRGVWRYGETLRWRWGGGVFLSVAEEREGWPTYCLCRQGAIALVFPKKMASSRNSSSCYNSMFDRVLMISRSPSSTMASALPFPSTRKWHPAKNLDRLDGSPFSENLRPSCSVVCSLEFIAVQPAISTNESSIYRLRLLALSCAVSTTTRPSTQLPKS